MKVDYLLIGAGMAGLVLRRFLRNERTVLVDQNPGGYKIGESVVPEQFQHPELRALVPKIQALPSYSPKYGTTFVSDDSIASFPLPPSEAGVAMHVARPEVENLMIAEWGIPISREKVLEIDPKNHVVRTDRNTYEVERQIIDCSGPAMVVGSALRDVTSLWPVWATWGYWDVEEDDGARFWQSVALSGKKYLRYDALRRQVLEVKEIPGWSPGRTTILTKQGEGIWSWQIPLRGSSLVSFGVVSRGGPVSEELYREVVQFGHSANFKLRERVSDGSSIFNRRYSREGFARRCGTAATLDYILLADAYGFADPVYSVGTAVAVNKAIELAGLLNESGWTAPLCAEWCTDSEQQLTRAIEAFQFWYSGALLKSDAAANEVRDNFLLGTAFQAKTAEHYGRVLKDAGLKSGGFAHDAGDGVMWYGDSAIRTTRLVRQLLGTPEGTTVAGWTLVECGARPGGLQIRWGLQDMPELVMDVDLQQSRPCFMKAGRIGLSMNNIFDRPYPFNERVARLFDTVTGSVATREREWLAMVEPGVAPRSALPET